MESSRLHDRTSLASRCVNHLDGAAAPHVAHTHELHNKHTTQGMVVVYGVIRAACNVTDACSTRQYKAVQGSTRQYKAVQSHLWYNPGQVGWRCGTNLHHHTVRQGLYTCICMQVGHRTRVNAHVFKHAQNHVCCVLKYSVSTIERERKIARPLNECH
jgi:hypothetical protein